MAKSAKKGTRHKYRNEMRPTARPRASTRSEAGQSQPAKKVDPPGMRTLKAAGGAIGAALACAYIARENWLPPKAVTGLLAAIGGTVAFVADKDSYRSVGQGVMSAAGAQLGLMLIDTHYQAVNGGGAPVVATASVRKKPANAESLPPGALEAAYERARRRLAMAEAASQMAA
jgi:hypothetical protein